MKKVGAAAFSLMRRPNRPSAAAVIVVAGGGEPRVRPGRHLVEKHMPLQEKVASRLATDPSDASKKAADRCRALVFRFKSGKRLSGPCLPEDARRSKATLALKACDTLKLLGADAAQETGADAERFLLSCAEHARGLADFADFGANLTDARRLLTSYVAQPALRPEIRSQIEAHSAKAAAALPLEAPLDVDANWSKSAAAEAVAIMLAGAMTTVRSWLVIGLCEAAGRVSEKAGAAAKDRVRTDCAFALRHNQLPAFAQRALAQLAASVGAPVPVAWWGRCADDALQHFAS